MPVAYSPLTDLTMGRIADLRHSAQPWNEGPPKELWAQTFDEWANDFNATADAAKEVLTYLQAQGNMDLFQHNEKAKRLYQNIIIAGVQKVVYGRNI